MRTFHSTLVLAFFVTVAVSAHASGFRCESREGFGVKLFNHVDPQLGTRVPAILIVSSDSEGTLLVRRTGEIRKHNLEDSVQYVVDGNDAIGVETVTLAIAFKEGQEIPETVPGQLILEDGRRFKRIVDLQCERYLKQ